MDTKRHYKIWKQIKDGKIFEAIDSLRNELVSISDTNLSDSLSRVETTYNYMIEYLLSGQPDASRTSVLNGIINQLHIINDGVLRLSESKTNSSSYYSALRMRSFSGAKLNILLDRHRDLEATLSLMEAAGSMDKDLLKKYEDILSEIFDYVLTTFDSAGDYSLIGQVLLDKDTSFYLRALVISALTLGLNTFYSPAAMKILLDVYENDKNDRTSPRALVGILLTVAQYPYRVSIDSNLMTRLELLKDDLIAYTHLRETARQLISARDTDRVNDKMKNEVIPEIMKLRPDIMKRMRESADGDFNPENNPEWEELLSDNKAGEKLKEFSELQSEGADVMMSAFSNLKNFPFFKRMSNWFMPFRFDNSYAVSDDYNRMELLKEILSVESPICDSDCYSMQLAFFQMPETQRNMMLSQMDQNISQIRENLKEMKARSTTPEFDIELMRYVRDLYRFFRIHKDRASYKDPFGKTFPFLELPVLKDIFESSEILHMLSEFYFKRGYYGDALDILMHLESEDASEVFYWEKRGYCYHSLKNMPEALSCYQKAELLRKPSKWLLEKLAVVNRRLGNFDASAKYFEQLLLSDPDNVRHILNLGNTLLAADKPAEAIDQFYHAEYLKPDSDKILRSVAWTEMLLKNYEKSYLVYKKLLSDKSDRDDLFNFGHVCLLMGLNREAIDSYTNAARLLEGDKKSELDKMFEEDRQLLEGLGIDKTTLDIVIDKTKHDI